jgi:cytochrome P450
MAFGVGIHRCLGSSLGRLMAKVAFEEVLARFPDYALTDDELDVVDDCSVVYAPASLPVELSRPIAASTAVVTATEDR